MKQITGELLPLRGPECLELSSSKDSGSRVSEYFEGRAG